MGSFAHQAMTIAALQSLSDDINSASSLDIEPWMAHFEDLVENNIHVALANGIFERILSGEHTALPSTNGKYVLLFHDRDVSLAVVRYVRPTKDILWSSEHFVQTAITANSCIATRYELPSGIVEDRFQTGLQIAPAQSARVFLGSSVMKGPRTVLDLSQFEAGPVDFVRLSLTPRGSFEWAFARGDCCATSITTTKYGESNMLGIVDLLAQAGNKRSAELLEGLCGHRLHFVRWHALRSLLELDSRRGLTQLNAALRDHHPEVAAAAARTLANLTQAELAEQPGSVS